MNWKHIKTGKIYNIVAFGIEEKTMRPVVVYSEAEQPDAVWTRPCEEFFDGRFQQHHSAKPNFGPGGLPPIAGLAQQPEGAPDPTERIARRDSVAVRPRVSETGQDA